MLKRLSGYLAILLTLSVPRLVSAQESLKLKYDNSVVYAGIEVGAKGVKMSLLELGKDLRTNGAFNILKDSSVNTDFISFTEPTFNATLDGLSSLYNTAVNKYKIPANHVFTVVSSGVKLQAEKESKTTWVNNLVDSFKVKIKDPRRRVEVVDAMQEARLSHLGIIPGNRRFSTFLIDIGSGNTKGGYFPIDDNTSEFKLFTFNWGTKSVNNAVEKKLDEYDKTLSSYNRQLNRSLTSIENSELIYAVNSSGAYAMNDYIAFSGGIAWAVATLAQPDQIDNPVVNLTYEDVQRLADQLYANYSSLQEAEILKNLKPSTDRDVVAREVKRVHGVFDQKALMAGTGLLLKIMRQFKSVYESKGFFLIKNGQVGWVSAYVDQTVSR